MSMILWPRRRSEARPYVRLAVRAYPELYFARFVIPAEGESEAIVLPQRQARVEAPDQSRIRHEQLASAALALRMTVAAGTAFAQQAAPTRVRGTIDSVSWQILNITGRGGEKFAVTVKQDAKVTEVSQIKIADIKPNSFVGTTAAQPDGELKAIEVHVFPESMRGMGEGHRPWDIGGPKSTMTNGTVGSNRLEEAIVCPLLVHTVYKPPLKRFPNCTKIAEEPRFGAGSQPGSRRSCRARGRPLADLAKKDFGLRARSTKKAPYLFRAGLLPYRQRRESVGPAPSPSNRWPSMSVNR